MAIEDLTPDHAGEEPFEEQIAALDRISRLQHRNRRVQGQLVELLDQIAARFVQQRHLILSQEKQIAQLKRENRAQSQQVDQLAHDLDAVLARNEDSIKQIERIMRAADAGPAAAPGAEAGLAAARRGPAPTVVEGMTADSVTPQVEDDLHPSEGLQLDQAVVPPPIPGAHGPGRGTLEPQQEELPGTFQHSDLELGHDEDEFAAYGAQSSTDGVGEDHGDLINPEIRAFSVLRRAYADQERG